MKRLVIFGLMLASAFALTNCTEQIQLQEPDNDIVVDESTIEAENPVEEVSIPFEVYANPSAETKTVNAGIFTNWEVNDKICVYHAAKGNTTTFHKHSEFTIRDVNEGLFGGALRQELSASNDWYFLYPYSSSEDTPKNAVVTIGASKDENGDFIQRQDAPGDRSHIAGNPYPMYGSRKDVAKSANPRVKMRHLSALVALKIVNQGDGTRDNGDMPITVRTIELEATSDIVGEFTVNFAGDNVSFTSKNAGKIAKLELAESVTIEPGNDATFYLAVKPFDASGKDLTVRINGSARKVKMPSDANISNFLSGQMKTLRVPVKLDYPKASDAIALTSKGTKSDDKAEKILTLPDPRDMNINGEIVPVYVLGENGNKGTITVRGYAKDMFAALPVGFYASRWNDLPTAMTLHSINAWLPEYATYWEGWNKKTNYAQVSKRTEIRNYGSLWLFNGILEFLGIKLFDNTYGILRTTIESFVDNIAKMTFKGMVANGDFDNNNVIILDENPVYKEVSPAKVDEFLSSFSADVNGKKCVATCAGLMSILIDATANSDGSFTFPDDESRILAEDTANAIFYKLENTIAKVNESLKGLIGVFFSDPTDLMRKLRDTKFQIVIETRPYEDTEGAPLNPIVFWGFDASGPDGSVPEN